MNIDLGNIFSRAWKITWKNKILWLFGVLAALGSGGSGNARGGSSNFNYRTGPSQYPQISGNWEQFLQRLQTLQPTIIAIIVGVACVVLLLSVVFLLLSLLGRGGLIGGARLADANGSVTFGEAWASGTQNLVRLLVIQLPAIALGLLIFVVAIAFAAVVLVTVSNGAASARSNPGEILGPIFGSLACLFILICPLGLIGLLLNILIHFAQFAAVLEDLSAMAAFRRAWEVIKGNVVSILVLGVILIVVNFLFSLIIGLPALLIIAPVIVGLGAGYAFGQSVPIATGVVFALVCCAFYVPVALVLRGIFETWATSAWTLAYQQFIHPAPAPAAPIAPYPVVPTGSSS